MNDSERYANSVIVTDDTHRSYRFCDRRRCDNKVYCQLASDVDIDRRWRYEGTVIVVSLEDGTNQRAFCSKKCAALWLI